MPIVKIVILNWNGAEHLRRFLPSVVAAAPAGVGVVVADNGSTDGSLAVLAESWALSTLSRAFSSWARVASDSTVHSTSPRETALPTSLSKPVTVPLPEA